MAAVAAFCSVTAGAAEWRVSTEAQFRKAGKAAKPGDEIVIANGRYANWRAGIPCRGTADKPIVIRPADRGETVFTGDVRIRITGSHVVMRKITFDKCSVSYRYGAILYLWEAKHCRVTECRFLNTSGRTPPIRIRRLAHDNRIDHCLFINTAQRCIQIIYCDHPKKGGPCLRNRIDHNLFQDVQPLGGNGRETIQIGQGRDALPVEMFALVERNVFLRCNGEGEIISNKSSRNTYRYNLFKDCRGELVMRGGSNCVIEGNRFEGCHGGIRLHGPGHRVVGNVIVGSTFMGLRIPFGCVSSYQVVENCLIANNTIVNAKYDGVSLGHDRGRKLKPGVVKDLPPRGNRIVNNVITGLRGVLMKVDHSPDNVIERNLFYATGDAKIGVQGKAAIIADPLFVNAFRGDFRLRPGSPALGAGLPLEPGAKAPNIGAPAEPLRAGPSVWAKKAPAATAD